MANKKYKLRILPLFEEKLSETVDYIAFTLRNPIAASNFVDAVEEAITERLDAPEAFAPYPSAKKREYTYYAIPVKNFLVFYVVIDDVMEVRTIEYGKRDFTKLL